MSDLIHQRCFHHSLREAVARCPECRRFYCRECITEHDDRLLCADCVQKALAAPKARGHSLAGILRLLQLGGALIVAWLFFYFAGEILLSVDPAFHEGTLWKEPWWTGRE